MRVVLLLAFALLAGCTLGDAEKPEKPDVPMPTDGPNQVVVKVPGMVCESCPQHVTEALAAIPWIDADSIYADRTIRQVRFKLKDRAEFDFETVRDRIRAAGFSGSKLLVGPTES